jgi:hypothetical protein
VFLLVLYSETKWEEWALDIRNAQKYSHFQVEITQNSIVAVGLNNKQIKNERKNGLVIYSLKTTNVFDTLICHGQLYFDVYFSKFYLFIQPVIV